MRNFKNNKKGITLVALIITIIVILILAVITISIFNDSGIVDKAEEAGSTYKEKQEEEISKLDEDEDIIYEYMGELPPVSLNNLLKLKFNNDQVMDCGRSISLIDPGDEVSVYSFGTAFRYNVQNNGIASDHYVKFTSLGKISELSDTELKEHMQYDYGERDYSVLRLDEYDESNNLLGAFSTPRSSKCFR